MPLERIVPGVGHSAMLLYELDLLPGEMGAVRLPEAWLGDKNEASEYDLYTSGKAALHHGMEMTARDDKLYPLRKYIVTFGGVALGAVSEVYFVQNEPPHEMVGAAMLDAGEEYATTTA